MTKNDQTVAISTLALEDLRMAVVELFGAERRVRGRDQYSRELTQSQLRALFALEKAEAVAAGQLARAADLNPASITAMLDTLEDRGIVERHRDSKDRRICMVSLTESGQAILRKRRQRWLALWESSFGDFTPDELATAVRIIRTVTQLMDSL